jgi:type I restriction enzyme M protein
MASALSQTLEKEHIVKAPNEATLRYRQIRETSLNQFFTRVKIAEILTEQFSNNIPRKIIDLGAGEGSLSAAMAKRWPNAEIVTVDIDQSCANELGANLKAAGNKKHHHVIHDVLDAQLTKSLSGFGSFDAAVCNPPFFKPAWKDDFASILKAANLLDACSSKADLSAEMLFLAQNINLVKPGGLVALIVPDGFLTGWRTTALRKNLLQNHRIECVIQLPAHSFHETEARCFMLFVTRSGKPSEKVKLIRYEGALSEAIYITRSAAEKRMDYDYHASHTEHEDFITLRHLDADIKRGSISMAEAKSTSLKVFHTTDFSDHPAEIRFVSKPQNVSSRVIVAEPGDILMARVDRNLHQKIAIVQSGSAILSDCVYRIRVAPSLQRQVFEAMKSEAGIAKILSATKGVGARLIGKADLLDLPFEIEADLSLSSKKLL